MSDTLFDPDDTLDLKPWQRPAKHLHRATDPDTSAAAAASLGNPVVAMRRTLLQQYHLARLNGLTAEEASYAAGYTPADGAWKRVSDLQNAGYVEDTGRTRSANSGRQQRVLVITDKGLEALT